MKAIVKVETIKKMVQNFFSEMIGTAILVFLGCMGMCQDSGGDVKSVENGVVLSSALAVFIAVQIASHNSGGHVNPAVTVLSLFFKKLNIPMAVVYILGQICGGIIGYGLLKVIAPYNILHHKLSDEYGLCTTIPSSNLTVAQALFSEFLLTTILLLVVCSAWDPRNASYGTHSLKIGFTIYSLAFAGAAFTTSSMNPARSLGPAIWNQAWKHHWIFWVGPLSAALFCGYTYTTFFCPKLTTA